MIACFIIIAAHAFTFYLILKTAVEKAENILCIRLKILNYFIENIVRKEAYLQTAMFRKFITKVFQSKFWWVEGSYRAEARCLAKFTSFLKFAFAKFSQDSKNCFDDVAVRSTVALVSHHDPASRHKCPNTIS